MSCKDSQSFRLSFDSVEKKFQMGRSDSIPERADQIKMGIEVNVGDFF